MGNKKREKNIGGKNMKSLRKASAFLLVGMMIMSGLVAFLSAPVSAHTIIPNTNNRFRVNYNAATMNAEMVYDVDPNDGSYYLLGEQSDAVTDRIATANTLTVTLECLNNWIIWFDDGTSQSRWISDVHVNITNDVTGVFDFQDSNTLSSAPDIQPTTGGAWSPAVGPAGNTTHPYTWTFDVLTTSGLGPSVDVPMRIWYNMNGTAQSQTFAIKIYISSIFDNPATEGHEILPDVQDATYNGDDVRFEAGDVFEAATINITNYAWQGKSINDLECYLTPPAGSGITLRFNRAWVPGTTNANATATLYYRVDVASRTLPGIYHGTAAINYTRMDNNLRITEPANAPIEFEVDYNFRDTNPIPVGNNESNEQCFASGVVIIDEEANTTKQIDSPNQEATTDATQATSQLTDRPINNIINRCFSWLDTPAFSKLATIYLLIKR